MGVGGSFVAGALSALLGVGGGPVKVPLMSLVMGVPFKVATATSNLTVGVTAAASVAAYALRGRLDLHTASPLVVGALAGSVVASRVMPQVSAAHLRRLFSAVLVVAALQMLWKGGGRAWLIP